MWQRVYEKRITQTAKASSVSFPSYTAHNLNALFVAYIFFVDMIITIRPHGPGEVRVDRMEAFREAVASVDSATSRRHEEYVPPQNY